MWPASPKYIYISSKLFFKRTAISKYVIATAKEEPIYNCNIDILFKMSHTVSAALSSCNQISTHWFYNYSFNCCNISKVCPMPEGSRQPLGCLLSFSLVIPINGKDGHYQCDLTHAHRQWNNILLSLLMDIDHTVAEQETESNAHFDEIP